MYAHQKITVYNRYIDEGTDAVTFERTVLLCHHVEPYEGKTTSSASGTNQSGAYSAKIFIPHLQPITNKQYCLPERYCRLKRKERAQFYTFSPEDIIYPFEVSADVGKSGIKDFMHKYPGGYKIVGMSNNDFGSARMRHFEVECRE